VRLLALEGSPEAAQLLAEAVVNREGPVQYAALDALRQLGERGLPDAQEAICHLATCDDQPLAREIALSAGYVPRDPARRALFFFLTEQFEEYELLDFEEGRPLLRAACVEASEGLKQRITDTARRNGYVAWASAVARRAIKAEEVSDVEWETALQVLVAGGRYHDIWLAVLKMPVKWSFEALRILADGERTGQWASGELQPWERRCWEELGAFYSSADSRPIIPAAGLLRELHGHTRSIWSVDFSRDGAVLATGGQDRTIRLWAMPGGDLVTTIRGHEDWISCLAFSEQTDVLASGSEDTTVRLWQIPQGSSLGCLRGHQKAVRCVAFHPTRDFVASGDEDGQIRFWNSKSGREIWNDSPTGLGTLLSLAFSPDGDTLAMGGQNGVTVLEQPFSSLPRPRQHLTWGPGTATSLAFDQDGELLAGAGEAGTIKVWKRHDWMPCHTLQAPCSIRALALNRSGRILVGGGDDGAIRFWRLTDGKLIRTLEHRTASAWCLSIGPAGWLLASGGTGEDGTVDLWSTIWEKPLAEATHRDLESVTRHLGSSEEALSEEELSGWRLLEALLRSKFRFDIALDGSGVIPVGEFDIEID
jgi:WD40 repeat protein